MVRPTVSIGQEIKPKHYVGADISITLRYKCEKWEVDLVEDAIADLLESMNHEVDSDYKQTLKEVK